MVDELLRQSLNYMDLPELACAFHWDTATLQARIKAYKPDYSLEDPWTWPRIRSVAHPSYGNGIAEAILPRGIAEAILPRGIAYPYSIVNMFTQRLRVIPIQQGPTGKVVEMEHDVYNFPFSYTAENVLKSGQHGWLLGTERQQTHRKSLEKEAARQTPPPKPTTSTEAFDEIPNMMNDTPPANTAELETLHNQLGKIKTKLVTAKEENVTCAKQTKSARAAQVNVEASIKTLKADRDSFKKLASDYTSRYRTVHRDLEASYKQRKEERALNEQDKEKTRAQIRINSMLEQTLRKKDMELKSAREDRTAKEQLLRIWTMMKMANETESGKRKGGSDASSLEAKKARTQY